MLCLSWKLRYCWWFSEVPIEVRQTVYPLVRWIVQYARLRGEHTMVERLAREIMMLNNTGASLKA